jgi:hypothetical protein
MPDGLTPRATVLLVAFAFGLAFCAQAVLGGESSPGRPAEAKQNATAASRGEPAAQPRLQLVAAGTVPALREPRKPRQRRARKVVRVAPTVTPEPVVPTATAEPVPTASPRYIPPTPQRTPAPTPKPATPKPTPPPTSTPPDSGEFDTTGER